MKDRQFHIYLDDEEYGRVLQALIDLKNNLIAQGRYTDAVDDVLIQQIQGLHPCGLRLQILPVLRRAAKKQDHLSCRRVRLRR